MDKNSILNSTLDLSDTRELSKYSIELRLEFQSIDGIKKTHTLSVSFPYDQKRYLDLTQIWLLPKKSNFLRIKD